MKVYPGLEQLVVDLQETLHVDPDLQHGADDEAHVPVQDTGLLLQVQHQEVYRHTEETLSQCNQNDFSTRRDDPQSKHGIITQDVQVLCGISLRLQNN